MTTVLVKAAYVITMSDTGKEITDGGLFVRNGIIEQVAPASELPQSADTVYDLADHIICPGLVNTHHHFYQTLTRAVPGAQNQNLFGWLRTLYPIWGRLTPPDIYISTQTALAELALSGCTTAADHLYIFPNGCRLDDEIEASKSVGLRLHAARGSMSLGVSKGGLPPDHVTEDEDFILKDSQRLIEQYHDSKPGSKLQITLAPCSPFSVTESLMRESSVLADSYGVHLHTHLAETADEEQFCMEKFGCRPVEYMEKVGWLKDRTWFAHSVYVNDSEIRQMAVHKCGVAHCPVSNMRLASGIAPVRKYLKAGVKVGLGVDGSASNDSSHMLDEVRQSMLLARLAQAVNVSEYAAEQFTARQALRLATRGGAAVLGRSDIGELSAGKCADFFALDLNRIEFAGALHDPATALIFCRTGYVDWNFVGGVPVVRERQLTGLDTGKLTEQHNRAARRLVNG